MSTIQEWLEPLKKDSHEASYQHSAIEAVYAITKETNDKLAQAQRQIEELEKQIAYLEECLDDYGSVRVPVRKRLTIATEALEKIAEEESEFQGNIRLSDGADIAREALEAIKGGAK